MATACCFRATCSVREKNVFLDDVTVEEVETELPYSLALTSWDYYQFEPYTNYGSPADPSIVEAGLLFQHRFAYTNTTVVFYAERSSYQGEQ